MTPDLYRRLGGAEGVAAIVDEAIDRHATHPLLAPRFRGRDLPELKALSLRFFGRDARAGPDDPRPGDGPTHAGMRFDDRELAAVVDDLTATMRAREIAPPAVEEVIGLLRAAAREPAREPAPEPG